MTTELPPWFRHAGIRLMERARRTHALRLLPPLLTSQWWEPERLSLLQRERLLALLRFCRDEVPFYRESFHRCALDPEAEHPEEQLLRLPVLSKKQVRAAGDTLHAASFRRWQPRLKSTSGSTGVPLNYYLDRPSHSYQWGHLWRGWHQAGYRPGDRYATLSGGSLVPERVDLKQKVYLFLSGAVHLPSYHLTEAIMTRYATLLSRRRVRFLYGYPSSLHLFASYVSSSFEGLPPLQAVFTTSESLGPKARESITAAFGCPVFDTYGCNDGGVYGFECAEQAGFHVGTESVVLEVVDTGGRPVPEGEVGRIVVTNLAIRAMPLLRYATGDMGALTHERCTCGRGLVRIVSLQGRARDFVLTPRGHQVHGAFFNHFAPFYSAAWLDRFQIYQPDRQRLVLRVVINREPTATERETLFTALQKGLGEMDFQLEIMDDLELTRTGKFRVIVSDVARSLEDQES